MTTPKTRQAKGLRVTFYLPDPKDEAVLVARAKRSGLTNGQTARLLMLRQAWMNAPSDPTEDRIENADNEVAGDWMDLPL